VYPDEADRRQHIDQQVTDLQARGYRVEELVERTSKDPAHEIAAIAEELGVQVIVCGTRALHGFPALLNGSVAARLIKHATVPVIVVPARVRELV
jgi:nucleotide-binding universal stress UspA family protein